MSADDGADLRRWLQSPAARFSTIAQECDRIGGYATSARKVADLMLAGPADPVDLAEAVALVAVDIAEERDVLREQRGSLLELTHTLTVENGTLKDALRITRGQLRDLQAKVA